METGPRGRDVGDENQRTQRRQGERRRRTFTIEEQVEESDEEPDKPPEERSKHRSVPRTWGEGGQNGNSITGTNIHLLLHIPTLR